VDYAYGSDITLANGADEIVLLAGLVEIDRVAYDGGTEFPDPNGISMELIDSSLDNTIGANWQEALTVFGNGDFGTPGAVNSVSSLPAPSVTIAYNGAQVLLDWDAVPGAVEYRVEVAGSLDGVFVPLATVPGTTLALSVDPGQPVRLLRVIALR
jgi:hypothetical protein